MVSGTWSSASGAGGLGRLLEMDPGLDGVFVANDQMALGVLHARSRARDRGAGGLAVVGFDGIEEGAQFTPSLTTVVQPLRELGERAVREVLAIASEARGWPPFAA